QQPAAPPQQQGYGGLGDGVVQAVGGSGGSPPRKRRLVVTSCIDCIAPRLYVGSVHALDNDAIELHRRNIKCVISIAPTLTEKAQRRLSQHFDLVHYGLSHEVFGRNTHATLRDATRRIRQAIHEKGVAVFVHCRSGMHRSIAVIVAYMMQEHAHMSWSEAFAYVSTRRTCAHAKYKGLVEEYIRGVPPPYPPPSRGAPLA
ncbi:protein-tyrosine phosphatase-like protein, partial [Haematococcus lacustris]